MEFNQIKSRLDFLILLATVFCILIFWSCGSDSSSHDSASDTGALSFNLIYHGEDSNPQSKTAAIDCAGQGIATVEAKVYEPDNAFLTGGGPWDCNAGQGTISSVPAGSDRTVVVLGKNADGKVVFNGQKEKINIIADSANNAGTIECYAFVPRLLAPADGTDISAGDVVLQWQDIDRATEYFVFISKNSDISDPVVEDHATTSDYTPSGLSYGTTYYWQVFAGDLYGNTGDRSQILSFTTHANTFPTAQISIPAMGSTYIVEEKAEFTGSGSDSEDGDLSGTSLVWNSNVVGQIGTGGTCSWSPLNTHTGTHTITLTATDSERAIGTDSVVITVAIGRLPDTGQIDSYTDTFGEDADYTISPPSYTKLDSNGNDLDDSASSWVMVRDDVTGLIWEVKTDDNSIHDKDNMYVWEKNPDDQDAKDVHDDFIAVLNKEEFGDKSDWRLPTIKELATLVHRGKLRPAINTDYFSNSTLSSDLSPDYWSGTIYANGKSSGAWVLTSYSGNESFYPKSNSYCVRAVRGRQLSGNLVDNDDNTVTDTATGLMWQQLEVLDDNGEISRMTWNNAIAYCDTLILAGYDDWRLPNINELRSIVDYEKMISEEEPAIDTRFFPKALSSYYWSSTSYPDSTHQAWYMLFYNGNDGPDPKTAMYYIRAVRGGQ